MLKKVAVSFGLVFLFLGIIGFFSQMTPDTRLFGLFRASIMHSILYTLTGLIALWAGIASTKAAHVFFQLFGIFYILLGVLGFGFGDQHILGFIPSTLESAWFHLIAGIIGLFLGFGITPKIKKLHKK